MNNLLLKLYLKMRELTQEDGQNLVEYALVVAMVAFGATAGMGALASGINKAFGDVSTKLATDITCILP